MFKVAKEIIRFSTDRTRQGRLSACSLVLRYVIPDLRYLIPPGRRLRSLILFWQLKYICISKQLKYLKNEARE